jgi:cell division protein FtsQ
MLARGTARWLARAIPGWWQALSSRAGMARAPVRAVWRNRRLRIALLAIVLGTPLLGGGWLWLRHSSLVSVQSVRISGVRGPDAGPIETALIGAARRMSTLDVHPRALRAAVAPFTVVREVQASASFPHGLHIRVIEQLPVAALVVGGTRTAVAADGVALGPALLSGNLPTLASGYEPAAGQRVRGSSLLGALTVIGAAPAPLAKLLARAYASPKGITVAMSNGLVAYFGDASRPHAKWLSLARVLADPSSAGAEYVDVRLPERPAAGFPPGSTPPAAGTSASASATSSSTAAELATPEGGAAALAAGLAAAVPAGSSQGRESPSSGSTSTEKTPQTPAAATPSTPAEAGGENGPAGSTTTPTPGG